MKHGVCPHSNGNTAKTVAKDLNGRGFKNCFVIAGGYEGRGGWVSSKLPIKVRGAPNDGFVTQHQ